MRVTVPLLTASAILVAAPSLALPITLTLDSSLLVAARGQTVVFSGTVADTGNTATFLNGDTINVAAPLVADDLPFFLNFPAMLLPLQSVHASLFSVMVPAGTPLGLYSGVFAIAGGSGPGAQGTLATQTFAVNVAAVPEPATALLLVSGAAGSGLVRLVRRRVRRRR